MQQDMVIDVVQEGELIWGAVCKVFLTWCQKEATKLGKG